MAAPLFKNGDILNTKVGRAVIVGTTTYLSGHISYVISTVRSDAVVQRQTLTEAELAFILIPKAAPKPAPKPVAPKP